MIDANELRVGNIFWESYGGYKIVDGLSHANHGYTVQAHARGYTAIGGYSLEHCFGVPITSDILEKCGFSWSIYHQAFHLGGSLVNEFYDLNECHPSGYQFSTFKKQNLIGYPFLCLHQLQNFYFALTGTELEINL